MALQSSGQITLSEIWSEYNSGATPGANQNISLGSLSVNTADGGGDPDAMSEFYGLSSAPALVNTENFAISTYVGNGSTQTIDAAPASKSAVFNGTNSKIDVGNQTWFNSNFTLSMWFYPSDVSGTSIQMLAAKRVTSDYTTQINLFIREQNASNPQKAAFSIGGGSPNFNYLYSSNTYNLNSWNFMAVKISGTAMSITLNGIETTATFVGTRQTNTSTIRFGNKYGTDNDYPFDGRLDQIRVYTSALSSSDIINLYNETNVPTSNLVAHYKLDGNANDSAGSYNGTATNITYIANAAVGPTISGGAAYFAGGAGTSKITTSLDLDSYDENWSISMWVKYDFDSTYRGIAGSCDSLSHNGMVIDQGTSGQIRFRLRINAASYSSLSSSGTYGDGQWHHIVVIKGGTTNYLYIDGNKEILSTATTNGVNHLGFTLGMIGTSTVTAYSMRGSIDDVRVYNDELTAAEALNIYNNTSIPTDNLISHWKLDGNANDEQGTHTSTVTNVGWVGGDFRPDMVWIKNRDQSSVSHILFDSVRGIELNKNLNTDNTGAEGNTIGGNPSMYGWVDSASSSGFTVKAGSTNGAFSNYTGNNFVGWTWKAGGPVVTNTSGTINSQVSANQAAGFSIVSYRGNGVQGATVGHGLSSAHEMFIVKNRDVNVNWGVWHKDLSTNGYLILNSNQAQGIASSVFPAQSSNSITLGTDGGVNVLNQDYIVYCFHSVAGYQKIGSYQGNSTTSGNIISTGFEPRFLLIKATNSAQDWFILDNQRGYNSSNGNVHKHLNSNNSDAENTDTTDRVKFTSTGFELVTNSNGFNASSVTYMYLAIA